AGPPYSASSSPGHPPPGDRPRLGRAIRAQPAGLSTTRGTPTSPGGGERWPRPGRRRPYGPHNVPGAPPQEGSGPPAVGRAPTSGTLLPTRRAQPLRRHPATAATGLLAAGVSLAYRPAARRRPG